MRFGSLLLAAALLLPLPTLGLGSSGCSRSMVCCRKGTLGCSCPMHCRSGVTNCSARRPLPRLFLAQPAVPPPAAPIAALPPWTSLGPASRWIGGATPPRPPVPPPRA
jgi:hypothetical protein